MWEHFARRVCHIQCGGKPDLSWVRNCYIAHALMLDLYHSMQNGSIFVETDWSHLKKVFGEIP